MPTNDKTVGNKIFDWVNYALLTLVSMITIIPFVYIVSVSFAAPSEVVKGGLLLIPTQFTLSAYKYIFSTDTMIRSIGVSIYVTVLGTLINLILTSFTAYPLARATLRGRKAFMLLILITMLFSGGMIPTYFVVKSVGLINSYWSLMIPTAISAFNLIVLKNFFSKFQMVWKMLRELMAVTISVLYSESCCLCLCQLWRLSACFTLWDIGIRSSMQSFISTILRNGPYRLCLGKLFSCLKTKLAIRPHSPIRRIICLKRFGWLQLWSRQYQLFSYIRSYRSISQKAFY